MENNEVVKKRLSARFIAIFLAACLLIGSALAITPSIQEVMMPDPYGIMPLMLDDTSTARTAYISRSINYGNYNGAFSYSGSCSSQTIDLAFSTSFTEVALASHTLEKSSFGTSKCYVRVASGTYVDYIADVSFPVEQYSSLVVSGSFDCYFKTFFPDGEGSSSVAASHELQLLVNGSPVGTVFDNTDYGATFSDQRIVLTEDVTTLGVRASWTEEVSNYTTYSGTPTVELLLVIDDMLSVIPNSSSGDSGDDSGDDSGGSSGTSEQMERLIAWQQNIYTKLTGIDNELDPDISSSMGSYVADTAENTSNIASIFARDDDIQLRDDVDDTLKEVTTQFYDQTSDSSSSMTVETVQNVKGISDGMDAMFSSGYSVSDAFTEIAENDDFMSWFTVETAQALDSTGNVATVDDEDKYNMHFYYDHIAELEERRGD